eukprot:535870_1
MVMTPKKKIYGICYNLIRFMVIFVQSLKSFLLTMRYMNTFLLIFIYYLPILHCSCISGDDMTCSLGGKCINNTCICDPTWTGLYCDVLDLLPSNKYKAFYRSYESSWGGSVLYDETDKQYHMFVSDMSYNCTLSSWQTNSRIIHTISYYPDGPYKMKNISIPIFSHNPTIHKIPNNAGYFIYHIGSANAKNGWKNCSNTSDNNLQSKSTFNPNRAYAKSLNDNWINYKGNGCNNPAALPFKNGTTLLVCKVKCPGNETCDMMNVAISSGWNDSFVTVTNLTNVQGEDAYIWRDPNGYYHMLFHILQPHKRGATAFSKDGYNWIYANRTEAFPHYFTLLNGTQVNVARRERHQLLFDSNGWPSYLFNGITPENDPNLFSYTGVQPINISLT